MGLPYLDAKQIKKNKELIGRAIAHKPNYFIRSGEVLKLVDQYAKTNHNILEAGCGAGDLAKSLLDKGYKHISLVDIDDYLRIDIRPQVNLALADLSRDQLPFADNSFDLILAIAIVEHLENPYHFVREAHRVLRPGGLMFMAIPYVFSIRARWKFLWSGDLTGYAKNNNHITLFTRAVFNKVFLRRFNLVREVYGESFVELFGKKIKFPFGGKYFSNKILYILEKNK